MTNVKQKWNVLPHSVELKIGNFGKSTKNTKKITLFFLMFQNLFLSFFLKKKKYRDIEFDLENDPNRCLHNLMDKNLFGISDIRRVPDIFQNPVFFSGTPKSAEIVQGAVEDCYLVSALSTMTSIERLIHNLCVAVSFLWLLD